LLINYKKEMKKIFLLSLFAFTILNSLGQEISKNALGLRLGSNDGFGGEVSYQKKLSKNNRVEVDLGISGGDYGAFKLSGLYQWVWNIEGGFNWYAGAGAGIGSWRVRESKKSPDKRESGSIVYATGDIGIEYLFDIPLQLAIDFRPEFYIFSEGYPRGFGNDIALSVRYRF
jgi:hypothetical protein